MPHLRSLSLSHAQGDWPTAADDIARLTSLRVLSLASARLSLDARSAIVDSLQQLPHLRSLNLSQWRLPSHVVVRVFQTLPHMSAIEHLVLVGMMQDAVRQPDDGAGSEEGPHRVFSACKQLRSLDLSSNPIESRRLMHASLVTQLTALHMAQNHVLGAPPTLAVLVLLPALQQDRDLVRLTIGGFAACTEAALMVAGAAPATLTYLELSSPLNKL